MLFVHSKLTAMIKQKNRTGKLNQKLQTWTDRFLQYDGHILQFVFYLQTWTDAQFFSAVTYRVSMTYDSGLKIRLDMREVSL